MHCAVTKFGYLQNKGISLWYIVPNSGLRIFYRVQSGSADIQSPQHLDAVVPATPNPGSRTRPQPAIDHYGAVSTFHDDNICETRFSMHCTSCLELTIPQTVLNSDSVAVVKSRVKTFLLSQAFCSYSAH